MNVKLDKSYAVERFSELKVFDAFTKGAAPMCSEANKWLRVCATASTPGINLS